MKRMFIVLGALGVAASSAMAGFTLTGQSGNSAGAVGNAGNTILQYTHGGPEFIVGNIIVEGDLTDGGLAGNWANDARLQFRNPAGQAANTPGLTSVQGYTGTIHVGPVTLTGANAILTGTTIGLWRIEMFEAFDEGAGADNIWSNLSIQVQDGTPPPPPAPAFSGNFLSTPNTLPYNTVRNGTTIWDPNNPQPGITDGAGEGAQLYASATFSNVGNEVGYRINHPGGDLIVDLYGIATDLDLHLLTAGGTPADAIATSDAGGTTAENVTILGAAAGVYYAVVDTYGSTNSGSAYSIVYTPEPASLVLLALGGLFVARRR